VPSALLSRLRSLVQKGFSYAYTSTSFYCKIWGFSLSAADDYAIALAVAKLRDRPRWLPGRCLRPGNDLHAVGLQCRDGTFHLVLHQHQNGFCRRDLIITPKEMQCRFGTVEFQLDPSPPIPPHGLVGGNLAAKMFDVERFGAILVEYRELGELDMHGALLIRYKPCTRPSSTNIAFILDRPVLSG